MLWVSRGRFVKTKQLDDEMSELQALNDFEKEWMSLPAGRKFGEGKLRRILWPMENFVMGYNSHSSTERTEWGTKALARLIINVLGLC